MSKALIKRQPLQMSWWDRFLLKIAPAWGLRRLRARASALTFARHYEAAGKGRRTSGWRRQSTDANSAAAPALVALRELARDLRRNNGWARRAIQIIANNTVGKGIKAKARGVSKARAKQALALWDAWAESTECDFDGRLTFSGLQRLVMNTVVESGEALVVREEATSDEDLAIPFRIRVLEPDYLDTLRDGITGPGGGPIVKGIELDAKGRRVAYWLFQEHPGSLGLGMLGRGRFESKRVAASDVLHVYMVDRPGQMRGVSWLAAAVAKLHDFDEYDDAVLMQQKIAALFGAFVTDLDGMATRLGTKPDDDTEDRLDELEPGAVKYLAPGQEINFATPPAKSEHSGYSVTMLRRIAATLGVTYEDLTQDFQKVNFSSSRMARLAHWRNVDDWQANMLVPQFCVGVWRWAMTLVAGLNGWRIVPSSTWTPPPMPVIEPDKEGLANARAIRTGQKTLFTIIREQGEDPEEFLAEYAQGNKRLDELGIVLDSDPRRTSGTGQAQNAAAFGDDGDAPNDGEDQGDTDTDADAESDDDAESNDGL